MKDWPQTVTELTSHLRNLRGGAPEVMKAFSNIAHAALAAKALDGKTKELIALGISVAIRCDDCIAFHAKAALKQGASRDEGPRLNTMYDFHTRYGIQPKHGQWRPGRDGGSITWCFADEALASAFAREFNPKQPP